MEASPLQYSQYSSQEPSLRLRLGLHRPRGLHLPLQLPTLHRPLFSKLVSLSLALALALSFSFSFPLPLVGKGFFTGSAPSFFDGRLSGCFSQQSEATWPLFPQCLQRLDLGHSDCTKPGSPQCFE